MTKSEQMKILDNKIKANNAQYVLDRKNAEISAISSGKLDKYEYLTGKDLGSKPNQIEKAKFEYSPLGTVFTAGTDKDTRKVGLLKTLQDICDINKGQLNQAQLNQANIPKSSIDDKSYAESDDESDGIDISSIDTMFYNVENNFRSYEEDFNSAGSLEAKFNIVKELAHDINSLRDSIMDDAIG